MRRKHSRKISAKQKTESAPKRTSARYPELARSVFLALQRLGALQNGGEKPETIGVAVSGGADSVALLRLLVEWREAHDAQKPFQIAVLHFNHQLRGRAANADERFVRQLAEECGAQFYAASCDVGAAAKQAKRNVEDTGRRERYAFFARLVNYGLVSWVATAHTMDDQAETVLAHVLRGTGLAGLAGIHARTGNLLRPLLGVRRAELRSYLKARKQSWREDRTNRDTTRTRALIRAQLIPLLEKRFQPEVVEHLAQLAEHARADAQFLDSAAAGKLRQSLAAAEARPDGSAGSEPVRVGVEDLIGADVDAALRGRMVRQIVKACKRGAGELGAQHVASVLQLAERGENGKALRLPGGVEVRREHSALRFQAEAGLRDGGGTAIVYEHTVERNDRMALISIPLLKRVFRFTKIDWASERGETSEKQAALDFARLTGHLLLRNWQAGDRLQPAGRSKVYKLKRLLNAAGVSRWERNGWPVLTNDGVLVWARGFPVAEEFAAGSATQVALVIDEEPL